MTHHTMQETNNAENTDSVKIIDPLEVNSSKLLQVEVKEDINGDDIKQEPNETQGGTERVPVIISAFGKY